MAHSLWHIVGTIRYPLIASSLVHVHAAVDADGLAGHKVAVIGSEEDNGAHQVCGILIALNGTALSAIGQLLRTRDSFLVRAGNGQAGHDRE